MGVQHKNNGDMNFYECFGLTKKVYLEYILLLQLNFPSSFPYSDAEEAASPTSQLLMEYEEHLRNTLEKDSESFSLQTFEALLSRSMENLGI